MNGAPATPRPCPDPRRPGHPAPAAANPGPGTHPPAPRASRGKSPSEAYFHCHNRRICGPPGRFPGPFFTPRWRSQRTKTERKKRTDQDSLPRFPGWHPACRTRRAFPRRRLPAHRYRTGQQRRGPASRPSRGHRPAHWGAAAAENGPLTLHVRRGQLLLVYRSGQGAVPEAGGHAERRHGPLAGLCDAARCPQATIHRQPPRSMGHVRRDHTETFLGNPRIPPGEKTQRAHPSAEHHRAQQVIQAHRHR